MEILMMVIYRIITMKRLCQYIFLNIFDRWLVESMHVKHAEIRVQKKALCKLALLLSHASKSHIIQLDIHTLVSDIQYGNYSPAMINEFLLTKVLFMAVDSDGKACTLQISITFTEEWQGCILVWARIIRKPNVKKKISTMFSTTFYQLENI